jgi:mannose-1-phosphate guanylyltransferase
MRVLNLILASGKGSRLFPISTEEKPKQFLPLYNHRTLIENTMFRFLPFVDEVYAVTLDKYKRWIKGKIPKIIYEPKRNESAYSVLFALKEIYEKEGDCIIVQTPADHFVKSDESFYKVIKEGIKAAREDGKICAIGVKPTRAESDFGYMIQSNENFEAHFIEKPSELLAKEIIKLGYIWNTAIYIYRLADVIHLYNIFEPEMVQRLLKDEDFYKDEPKQFERVIIEKTSRLKVIEGVFDWDDIGNHERLDRIGGDVNGREKNQTYT